MKNVQFIIFIGPNSGPKTMILEIKKEKIHQFALVSSIFANWFISNRNLENFTCDILQPLF